VAAPIASQVLGEVLPYLEIAKDNESEEDVKIEVTVPDLTGKTKSEAKKELEELGLSVEEKEEQESEEQQEEKTIVNQLPKAGIKVKQGNSVIIYY